MATRITNKMVLTSMVENFDVIAPMVGWDETYREKLRQMVTATERKNSSKGGASKSVQINDSVREFLKENVFNANIGRDFGIAELVLICNGNSNGENKWGEFTSNRIVGLVTPLVKEGFLTKGKGEVDGKKVVVYTRA